MVVRSRALLLLAVLALLVVGVAAGARLAAALQPQAVDATGTGEIVPVVGQAVDLAAVGAAPEGDFAGSETCQTCHGGVYASWQNTLHASMIRPIAKGDLGNAHADLAVEGAPQPDQYDWALVIGGWYKEERYAYHDAEGDIKTGEFEYNVPKGSFTLRKDRAGNPEALDWINECGGCHATGMDSATRSWSEFNITCEACHGPAANHAKNPMTVRPVVDRSAEACGRCHIRGRDQSGTTGWPAGYEVGKPETLLATFNPILMTGTASVFPDQKNSNRHRQQFLDWSKSGHAAAGVACVTCHKPHEGALTERGVDLRAPGNELCATCHGPRAADQAAHAGHGPEQAACASCHMPKLIGSGSVSTHTFEAIAPAKTLELGPTMANSCTGTCHKTWSAEEADARFKAIFSR